MASKVSPAAISTIMTVFNGAQYIGAAIESLVHQSLPPTQIIVVDDGSTDDSGERALAAGGSLVQLIRQPNRGMNAARNAGRIAATGDFVHFSDADDVVPMDAFEAMHAALLVNPAWDAVFGQWRNFWVEELADERDLAAVHLKNMQKGLCLTAGMFRRRILHDSPNFATRSDWDGAKLWMMAMKNEGATFGTIEALTLERRVHVGNRSRQKSLDGLTDLVLNLHRAAREAARKSADGRSKG
jgi:glycosyltransferase involved in cell wall biosynthesis